MIPINKMAHLPTSIDRLCCISSIPVRRVGHGAFTGFIGEQAPLDAVHDAGAEAAGYGSLWSKGIADDQINNLGNLFEIQYDDNERQQQVRTCHHRHQHFGDPCHKVGAAANHKGNQD